MRFCLFFIPLFEYLRDSWSYLWHLVSEMAAETGFNAVQVPQQQEQQDPQCCSFTYVSYSAESSGLNICSQIADSERERGAFLSASNYTHSDSDKTCFL